MNSKEVVQNSLAHKATGKVAVDFGSTPVSGMHVYAIERLRRHYGLEEKPVKVVEPYQMLGEIDQELADIIGIDTVGIPSRKNMFGFENKGWKEFKTFWGQTVLVPADFNTSTDSEGDLLIYPEGDTSVPASAKMPRAGYFFDTIIRQEPIDEDRLNVEDNLEEFGEISQQDLDYWAAQAEIMKQTEKAVVVNFGGTALGDIALVPGPFMKHPKGIRDVAEWYMSTLMRPDFVKEIFEMQTDIAIRNLSRVFDVVGNLPDVVFICGTDFGTQDSQFCSPESFDDLYLPYYRKINDWIHQNTTWKTFKHSCGAIDPILPNIINAGFDIINPVQINAAGMDGKMLKEKYGNDITFWGGGVDTQRTLSFGTPAEVETQVLEQCEILSKNGGFIFNAVHNVQSNVPTENLVAMIDAIHKFNNN
jgi:Uroporphyrinogen-III decarboxylase